MGQTTNLRGGLAVVLLVGMVTLAGCSGGLLGGSGGGTPPAADQVPANVTTIVHVDMAITDDATTQAIAEAGADTAPAPGVDQPENVSEAQSEFQTETGLNPDDAEEIVAFGKQSQSAGMGSDEYSGVIIHADWETQKVVDAVRNESDTELEETTYNGQTVYRPTEEPEFGTAEWFGVLGDGQFVFGSEAAVKDTIDVTAGDAQTFSGDLRSAYDDSRDGLVTFAATVPQEQIPEQGGQIDTGAYRDVETISGVYYTSSNSAGFEMKMYATGSDSAQDVADVTDGAISIASGYTQNETAKDALRNIEVTRDGATVTMSFEESVSTLQAVIRYLNEA